MNVQDIMTSKPIVVQHDTPVLEALALLQDLNVRHLPVLEGSKLLGMVSDRDLRGIYAADTVDEHALRNMVEQYRQPITELMSSDILQTHPESDVGEVIDLMLQNRVGAVPVTDPFSGDLVGIVSYVDVLKAARDYFEEA